MSELLELMKTRRSIRQYQPDPVPQPLLEKIMEAGLYAASARGKQSCIIVEVTNPAVREKIVRMNCAIGGWESSFDPFYGAPAMLIVLGNREFPNYIYDGPIVMDNMMLAAHALGLGSCWIHRAKEEFESPEGKELLKSWGITGDFEGIGHCAVGYCAGAYPEIPPRNPNRIFRVL